MTTDLLGVEQVQTPPIAIPISLPYSETGSNMGAFQSPTLHPVDPSATSFDPGGIYGIGTDPDGSVWYENYDANGYGIRATRIYEAQANILWGIYVASPAAQASALANWQAAPKPGLDTTSVTSSTPVDQVQAAVDQVQAAVSALANQSAATPAATTSSTGFDLSGVTDFISNNIFWIIIAIAAFFILRTFFSQPVAGTAKRRVRYANRY